MIFHKLYELVCNIIGEITYSNIKLKDWINMINELLQSMFLEYLSYYWKKSDIVEEIYDTSCQFRKQYLQEIVKNELTILTYCQRKLWSLWTHILFVKNATPRIHMNKMKLITQVRYTAIDNWLELSNSAWSVEISIQCEASMRCNGIAFIQDNIFIVNLDILNVRSIN